jgi:hypothetical protein
METKDYMLEFLKHEAQTSFIEEVIDIKTKDSDDSNGAIGQHYIVTANIRVPDFSFTSGNQTKIVEAKCLVSVKQFINYVEKRRAIIWL